jgi:hypothetical protein
MKLDCKLAVEEFSGEPVSGFHISFKWHKNYWEPIFDAQIDLIRRDIARALADDKLIVYLSCPISARGGGDRSTNVEIARSTERRLLNQWGERFWILNPAQYQMESEEGQSLMQRHAIALGIDLDELRKCHKGLAPAPSGGDYMRMWTKVLVEDHPTYKVKDKETGEEKQVGYYKIDKSGSDSQAPRDTAQHFDAFYFLGPTDVQDFFSRSGGTTLTSGIETHFARKFANDPDFRDAFSVPGITWDSKYKKNSDPAQDKLRAQWDGLRRSYLRFYSVGASVNFSLGSHDEWNIFRLVNKKRRERYGTDDNRGIAEQLGGFFDGSQIDPASTESFLSKGYAIRTAGDQDECRISTEGSRKPSE